LDRLKTTLRFVDLAGRGLEIGPSYSPLVPKASGARVETVDHADRDTLVEKYRAWGLPEEKLAQIEEVDYIWAGGSLAEAVGERGAFEYIVASHLVEHTVDLIGFLRDCSVLLTPDGVLSLVVPDKRYCFDRFQPHTSVGAAVDAHVFPRRFHTPGSLLDHHAYASKRGESAIAWDPLDAAPLSLQFDDITAGRDSIEAGLSGDSYHDVHRWKFTPSSFRLLVQDLRALGYHDLVEAGDVVTRRFEFFITFRKASGDDPELDRMTMLRAVESELAAPLAAGQPPSSGAASGGRGRRTVSSMFRLGDLQALLVATARRVRGGRADG